MHIDATSAHWMFRVVSLRYEGIPRTGPSELWGSAAIISGRECKPSHDVTASRHCLLRCDFVSLQPEPEPERAAVLSKLHSERFVDASPAAVYATHLADRGNLGVPSFGFNV